MAHIALLLLLAAVIGVVGATSLTCTVGLISGTNTWCGFIFAWPVGLFFAVPLALVLGLPADWLFRRFSIRQWWPFVLLGVLASVPVWYSLAEPFDSARWRSSGLFDSLNYLGCGAIAGFAYWWFRVHREEAS
jgi:hypothetical protein